MKLIGLSGKKEAGKDSFYNALAQVANVPIMRMALADPLKDEVYEYILKPHGIDREALDDERKKHFRLILQGWGTDFKRNFFGSDYWVKVFDKRLQEIKASGFDGIVVITDIRFLDEANYVKSVDGVLVRIDRPNHRTTDSHSSENALDDYSFDEWITNDGSIEDLLIPAKAFLANL